MKSVRDSKVWHGLFYIGPPLCELKHFHSTTWLCCKLSRKVSYSGLLAWFLQTSFHVSCVMVTLFSFRSQTECYFVKQICLYCPKLAAYCWRPNYFLCFCNDYSTCMCKLYNQINIPNTKMSFCYPLILQCIDIYQKKEEEHYYLFV